MGLIRIHCTAQKIFLAAGVWFFLLLAGSVTAQSMGRNSVLAAGSAGDDAFFRGSQRAGADGPRPRGSKLHLHQFRRVEVKKGQPIWAIEAKEARYFAGQEVTHVNDADVTVYRAPNSSVRVLSKAARLYLGKGSVSTAELEGEVELTLENSIVVNTEVAVYSADRRKINSPDLVEIRGEGFYVKGYGLEFDVDSQNMKLSRQVSSYFEPAAKIPKVVIPKPR